MDYTPKTLEKIADIMTGSLMPWCVNLAQRIRSHAAAWECGGRDDLIRTSLNYDGATKTLGIHWLNCDTCRAGEECDTYSDLQTAEAEARQEWRKALGVSPYAPNATGDAD